MPRYLPSLNALRTFEAAARHGSFTRAAAELCVTQGAVSQQVKSLESELALKLFRRDHHKLSLTESGRLYLDVVRDGLDRIAAGTERLLERQRAGVLNVSVSPNFASKWLVHRLARFSTAHPSIDLRISASIQHVDFIRDDIDLAVRHGDGRDTGLHLTRLCLEELVIVCSPSILSGKRTLRTPSDLKNFTLLHTDDRSDWQRWVAAADASDIDTNRGPVFNQASMTIDAAVDGQGIALARSALAARDLISGRLIRPFPQSLSVPYAYWIVCPVANANLPKIKIFRDWLLAEAAEDVRLEKGVKSGTHSPA